MDTAEMSAVVECYVQLFSGLDPWRFEAAYHSIIQQLGVKQLLLKVLCCHPVVPRGRFCLLGVKVSYDCYE